MSSVNTVSIITEQRKPKTPVIFGTVGEGKQQSTKHSWSDNKRKIEEMNVVITFSQ